MLDKIKKIQKKVKEAGKIKQTKESEIRLADLIRDNLENTLGQKLLKLSKCVFALQQATEKVQKEIAEKQTIADTQKVSGKITVANPEALKQKDVKVKGKVEVVNQVDLEPLREGIDNVLRIASNLMNENSREHSLALDKMFKFLEGTAKKENNELLRALSPLQFLSDHPMKSLSVRLSDGEKFYKAMATLGQQIYAASNEKHRNYKAYDLTVTGTEQEVDFGNVYTSFAVANGVVAAIELKLNDNTNDIILIDKSGNMAHDSFKVEKIYLRSTAGNTPVTVFVTRQ